MNDMRYCSFVFSLVAALVVHLQVEQKRQAEANKRVASCAHYQNNVRY